MLDLTAIYAARYPFFEAFSWVYSVQGCPAELSFDKPRVDLWENGEMGATVGEYSLSLASEPSSPVTVSIGETGSIGESGDVMLSSEQLVFSTANWMAPQTVTVAVVDDSIDEGDRAELLGREKARTACPKDL